MTNTNDQIVYHYCSLEVFKSIIENECLWLCDVQKSNDSQERIYFEKIMLEQIELCIESALEKHYLDIAQIFQSIKDAILSPSSLRKPIYSCSFSYNGDQLGQWRGYADDGRGVAIGFDATAFQKYLPEENFRAVVYKYDEATQRCADIVEQAINIYSAWKEKANRAVSTDVFKNYVLYPMVLEGVFYKSHFFHEENECRLVTADPVGDYSESISCFEAENYSFSYTIPYLTPSDTQNLQLSEKKFRVSKRGLSGYYELSFSNIKNDIIKSIILGPKCPTNEQEITQFLQFNIYSDKINVKCSEGTYC